MDIEPDVCARLEERRDVPGLRTEPSVRSEIANRYGDSSSRLAIPVEDG